MRIRTAIGLTVLFAGCATSPSTTTPMAPVPGKPAVAPSVNLAGYSPAFRAGYADGCASVGAASRTRDEQRFKTETDYAMGWRDGNDICRRRK